MKKYIIKRIITAFLVVLFVIGINFMIIRLAPGDPVTIMAGFDNPSEEYKMAITQKYNLDKPLLEQFVSYVSLLFKGDLGVSYYSNTKVSNLLWERLGASLLLSGSSAILAFVIGVAVGMMAGKNQGGRLDKIFTGGSYICNSVPSFWLGLMLICVFASQLGWFPTQGMYDVRSNYHGLEKLIDLMKHLFLPLVTLVLVQIPIYFRIMKSSVRQVLTDEYIITFKVTGMSERKIFFKYVLKNSILPAVTVFGINLAYIVAGSTLVETVFSWQGIGVLIYTAISKRDYNVLMGAYFFIAVSVAIFMILVDLVYARLDPRIRYE